MFFFFSIYLQSILYMYKWSLWWHDLFRQISYSVEIRWDLTIGGEELPVQASSLIVEFDASW